MDPAVVTETGDRANRWVRRFYLAMIFGTIGLMVLSLVLHPDSQLLPTHVELGDQPVALVDRDLSVGRTHPRIREQ